MENKKPIWELQHSPDILLRQEFVKRIKTEFMPKVQKSFARLEGYELELQIHFLKGLKVLLSNYDIYNQRMVCRICQETECICYIVDESKITEEEITKLL